MALIKRIPFKALGVFTIGLVLGLWLGNKNTLKTTKAVLNTQSVAEAINKPTNENKTSIEFVDNKFKKTDSISISLSQEPKTKQEISLDSCKALRKKIQRLTKTQKRKFERW